MSQFLNFAGNQGTTFKNHGTGGGTSFTLDLQATTNSVLLAVGGVLQEPGVSYSVEGTTITTSSSVAAGIEVFSWILHKPGTAPVIQDNSVTGGKIALTSQAEGDIMYCNASGDWVRLAAGTSGQFLQTQGAGSNPVWAAASSDVVLLATNTPSAASTSDFTAFDNATYSGYMFTFANVIPATDAVHFAIRTSTNGGSTYDSASYYSLVNGATGSGGNTYSQTAGAAQLPLSGGSAGADYKIGSAANEDGVTGSLLMTGNADTGHKTQMKWEIGYISANSQNTIQTGHGYRNASEDVDACQFLMTSGNIESGTIKMYGLK